MEQASQRMTIKAPPERCFDVFTDFERYPDWASDVKEVSILETDSSGRAAKVRFHVAAMGRSTNYALAYDYTKAPNELSWVLVEGDLEKRLDGRLILEPDDDRTEVTYQLAVELLVPVPSFLKRRVETRILSALDDLKARAES